MTLQAYSRVKESWAWLQASGLPVHITCVNSYLTALIKEVSSVAVLSNLIQNLIQNTGGNTLNSSDWG